MKSIRSILLKIPLIRFAALFRAKSGALGQIGWTRHSIPDLLVSGEIAVPWFTYGAIDFADQLVPPDARVLELGGGGSTRYWLERGNSVVTVETSESWSSLMRSVLTEAHPTWVCVHMQKITSQNLDSLDLGTFDVIVNDFNGGDRGSVSQWMLKHLNAGGLVIWDNTDRENYQSGIKELEEAGLGHVSFFGLGPVNSYASQTSFFSSSITTPSWRLLKRKTIRY